jgi:hypothetical protein
MKRLSVTNVSGERIDDLHFLVSVCPEIYTLIKIITHYLLYHFVQKTIQKEGLGPCKHSFWVLTNTVKYEERVLHTMKTYGAVEGKLHTLLICRD